MDTNKNQDYQSLVYLKSLFPSQNMCNIWSYDYSGNLISSTCTGKEQSFLDKLFRRTDWLKKALNMIKSKKDIKPFLLGSPIGLQWSAIVSGDRRRNSLFILGPVFYTALSEDQVLRKLEETNETRFLPIIKTIPVIPLAAFLGLIVNMYNALTGQNLTTTDLFEQTNQNGMPFSVQTDPKRNRDRIYTSEQEMLRMVREGNINYLKAFLTSAYISTGVPVQGKDPLRQAKTSLVVLETLISRAAMEGGLSPEVAYPLGDSYLKAVEDSEDISELFAISTAMLHDFVYRVHRTRNSKGYSATIQKCCDYIEVSQDKQISAADLSALCGYSEYYLTEKFKKETGFSLNDYIKKTKIEMAKNLLVSTSLSVKEISNQLAFNTPNYFIKCFKDITGKTPTNYRKGNSTLS